MRCKPFLAPRDQSRRLSQHSACTGQPNIPTPPGNSLQTTPYNHYHPHPRRHVPCHCPDKRVLHPCIGQISCRASRPSLTTHSGLLRRDRSGRSRQPLAITVGYGRSLTDRPRHLGNKRHGRPLPSYIGGMCIQLKGGLHGSRNSIGSVKISSREWSRLTQVCVTSDVVCLRHHNLSRWNL